MGQNLLEIKKKTQDDYIRTCVSDLVDPGDASAHEKYYHVKCLRTAQCTFTPVSNNNVQFIFSVCDEERLISVRNSLTDDGTFNMAEVNSAFVSILKLYQVEINETGNYRMHLKKLINEHLPHVQFTKPQRKNEPETLTLSATVSKAVEVHAV